MLHLGSNNGYLALDAEECRQAEAAIFAQKYQNASPFPHIVIDDFLEPAVLQRILDDFPNHDGKDFFDRDQERFKFQFQPSESGSGIIRNIFAELNGQAFLAFFERVDGNARSNFRSLFRGRRTAQERNEGDTWGFYADFNIHEQLKLERKLNLLIYLNQDSLREFMVVILSCGINR